MKPQSPSVARTNAAPEFFSSQVAEARRFYLDLAPPRHLRLAVVCGGLEHCTSDYAIHRSSFPFYSIEYVVRGRGELTLKGHTHLLQPGRLFSYGPGAPHHITTDPNDPLVKYFLDFRGTHTKQLLRSCRLASGGVGQVFPPNILSSLFDELILAGLHARRGSANLCVKLLECLVLKIAGTTGPVASAETFAFNTYEQCRRHIEQHFLRLQTLEQIAQESHASKAYLCRLFRRYDHQSPYQYLLRLKMNHAAEQLQRPSILVKQVADLVGFSDPFHFSRVFRNVLGVSPSEFRGLR